MNGNKTLLFSTTIAATLILSACGSHKNPLLTQPKKATVRFVKNAQDFASKKTGVMYGDGVYSECIVNPEHFDFLDGKGAGAKRCAKVFKAMVEYAEKSKDFSSLTVSDLKDKAVQKRFGSTAFDY